MMDRKKAWISVAGVIVLVGFGLFSGEAGMAWFLYFPEEWSSTVYFPLLLQDWPPPGRLLITELVYDPAGSEPGGEWIEIFNLGGRTLDLSQYKVGDEETLGEQEGMFQFPPGETLDPRSVAVVASQASIFLSLHGRLPDYEMRDSDSEVPDMIRHSAWAGGNVELGNTGDEVLLLDGAGQVVDFLGWGSSAWGFDPGVPRVSDGHSLERCPGNVDTDTAAEWRQQLNPAPGVVELECATPTPEGTASPEDIATPTTQSTGLPEATSTPPVGGYVLVINEVHADPDSQLGDANGDKIIHSTADEFIEIVNNGAGSADLSGWTVRDLVRVRHTFPPNTIIPAGCAIVVFGGGAPAGSFGGSQVQVASGGTLGLNNDGDRLALVGVNLEEVATVAYGAEGGDNQSLTRDPDILGPEPLVKHMESTLGFGSRYSPGTKADGSQFQGCEQLP